MMGKWINCQKQTTNYHVLHFSTYEDFREKTGSLRTCLCWTCIFSSVLPIGGLDDSKQLQAQPTTDHGVKISKYVSSFFNFGLSSARAVAIPYKHVSALIGTTKEKWPIASLCSSMSDRIVVSSAPFERPAMLFLGLLCDAFDSPAGIAWFGLERMIAPCLGMIFACNLLQAVSWWIWLASAQASFFAVAPAKYQQNAAGNGTGKDTLTSAQGEPGRQQQNKAAKQTFVAVYVPWPLSLLDVYHAVPVTFQMVERQNLVDIAIGYKVTWQHSFKPIGIWMHCVHRENLTLAPEDEDTTRRHKMCV